MEFGKCDDCGATICDGDRFYGLHYYFACIEGQTISPAEDFWIACYCPACSLRYDLTAIVLPSGRIDRDGVAALDCPTCASTPNDGNQVVCVELVRYNERGLHDPEYLLEHFFCCGCFASEQGKMARLDTMNT